MFEIEDTQPIHVVHPRPQNLEFFAIKPITTDFATQIVPALPNLEPYVPKNFYPSGIAKKESSIELQTILEPFDLIPKSQDAIELSHVTAMTSEPQYEPLAVAVQRKSIDWWKSSAGTYYYQTRTMLVEIAKGPAIGRKNMLGYQFHFSVDLDEINTDILVTMIRNNAKALKFEYTDENKEKQKRTLTFTKGRTFHQIHLKSLREDISSSGRSLQPTLFPSL